MRLIYLDTVIVIYAVEGSTPFQTRALARMLSLRGAGDKAAVSDLTWLECRTKPIRINDSIALANYYNFLTAANVVRLALPTAVFERATLIRPATTTGWPMLSTWPRLWRLVVMHF